MNVRRVCVLGSSISMLVRPDGSGDPYPRVLERILNCAGDDLWLIENQSEIAATVDSISTHLATRIVAAQPDVTILHYGHVEAIRRPHSKRMWLWTHLYVPGMTPRARKVRIIGRWYAAARRRLGLTQQWVPLSRFHHALSEGIEYLQRNTSKTIILIEANPWNESIEAYGPGTNGQIEKYNAAMREIATSHGIELLELSELSAADPFHRPVQDFIPDGTHFSGEGHRLLAQVLADRISRNRQLSFGQVAGDAAPSPTAGRLFDELSYG